MSARALSDILIFLVLVGIGFVFIRLEANALQHWRGVWRWLAVAPAVLVAWITLGIILSPAAHTLWQIEIILWLVPGMLLLLILRGVLLYRTRSHATPGAPG